MNVSSTRVVDVDDLVAAIDGGWVLMSAFGVMLMQLGFAMLEMGTSAAASATAITMKNLADMAVTTVAFYFVGWGLTQLPANDFVPAVTSGSFAFAFSFASTAVTIVSGSVTGRLRFRHYLLLAFVMSAIVYPMVAQAAWSPSGWLHGLGFIDFAGSGVVHMCGGAFGLAASLWLGPRPGVFPEDTSPERTCCRGRGEYHPQRSSPTQTLLGSVVLWVAWFSFNSGSSQRLTDGGLALAATAATSTLLGSACGLLLALAWSLLRSGGDHVDVFDAATGLLAGLVGVTASCAMVYPLEACLVGALASLAALGMSVGLERVGVDDAVAVAPVHLGAGAVGVVLAGIVSNGGNGAAAAGLAHGGGWAPLGVQLLGALVITVWAGLCFGITALASDCLLGRCCGTLRVPTARRHARRAKASDGAVAPTSSEAEQHEGSLNRRHHGGGRSDSSA